MPSWTEARGVHLLSSIKELLSWSLDHLCSTDVDSASDSFLSFLGPRPFRGLLSSSQSQGEPVPIDILSSRIPARPIVLLLPGPWRVRVGALVSPQRLLPHLLPPHSDTGAPAVPALGQAGRCQRHTPGAGPERHRSHLLGRRAPKALGGRGEGGASGSGGSAGQLVPAPAARTMRAWLWALLCLGQCRGVGTEDNETLPRPQILLEEGSVIPLGRPAHIRCRGPEQALLFMLQKEDDPDFLESREPIWNEALFSFPRAHAGTAGLYSCLYQTLWGVSPPSEGQRLAVAGIIPKPYLSVKPNSTVTSGQALMFKCWSDQKLDRLILYQDRGSIPPMYRLAPNSEVELRFPKASSKHEGNYSCIGYISTDPFTWSQPSNPVVLTVSQSQDHTVGIIILVLLLALGALLS
ncbi:leukocyte immunoglobulin-like receptor subfamily A member 5 [Macrotis lagotis]|uniref:leukocyte immunoglobulin-like receptor subfamily A member 5 n=1 Tax=Macrotis lagotis TaxID=92651 RepID=UPI003D69E2B9